MSLITLFKFVVYGHTKTNEPEIQFSAKNWKKITGVSNKKLQLFLVFCQKFKIFDVKLEKNSPKMITIGCPNLLKYRDEYASRK